MDSNSSPLQLKFGNLASTNQENRLLGIKKSYAGKVRDVYTTEDGYFVMITSDAVSAYDVILPKNLPNKGIILNQMTIDAFKTIGKQVPHWFISSPHPRVLIGKQTDPIKAEVIVRGNLEGSAWRAYNDDGKRNFWGTILPEGMREHDKLSQPIVTPTTKAPLGQHDADITAEKIIEHGICTREQWEIIERYALQLFGIGTEAAAKRGLILLDTKYEFGLDSDGEPILIDEVHTMDSSRFFTIEAYDAWLARGEEPQPISKEFIRNWLKEHGFMGKEGQVLPVISPEIWKSFQDRYYEGYTLLTGQKMESEIEIATLSDELKGAIMYGLRSLRKPQVAIIMGSDSDLNVMKPAGDILDEFCIGHEMTVVSAHRTPERMVDYAKKARRRGFKAIIAGAGGAAHLPGMTASCTTLPVIGVPVKSEKSILGLDSSFSIQQMPGGIPVATMAVDGALNAGLQAIRQLAAFDDVLDEKLVAYQQKLKDKVDKAVDHLEEEGYPNTFDF